jgi:enamine deaminase RidA (YjgF/YER057c/UK114 family)
MPRYLETGARMSQAVVANGFVYLAGQVADDTSQGVEGQTRQVLASIDRLLALAGSSRQKIVSANVYLPDIADFAAMNRAWDATTEARLAAAEYRVEIQLVAVT